MNFFTDDDLIAANVNQQVAIARTHNVMAIANDNLYMSNWARNAPLYKAAGMAVPPQPNVPEIWTVNEARVRELFLAYNDRIKSGEPAGELDFSPAISKALHVRPVPAGPVVTPQPLNPLGVAQGRGKRSPAPGDRNPIGYEYTDEMFDVWVKTSENSFGGAQTVTYNRQ